MKKVFVFILILFLLFCVACDPLVEEEPKETSTSKPEILPSDRNITELPALISISCDTEGAAIWFTTDGSDPRRSETVQLYSSPFFIYDTQHQGRAYATHAELSDSAVVSAAFTYPTVKTPTITPKLYLFNYLYAGEKVEITCETEDAIIYYTTDGSIPTINSTMYTEPFELTAPSPSQRIVKVSAIAIKEGMYDSVMAQTQYNVQDLANPSFSPSAGSITEGTQVSITCRSPGAVIYYQIDSGDYSIYENPITVNSSCVISAYSQLDGYDDMHSSVCFTVSEPPATKTDFPVLSIPSGTINISDRIYISCPDENASIYYTVDGTDPRTSETREQYGHNHSRFDGLGVYLDSLDDRSFELKASALVDGKDYSDVVSATYTIANFSLYRTWEIVNGENDYDRLSFSQDGFFSYESKYPRDDGSYQTNTMAGSFSIDGNTITYVIPEYGESDLEEELTVNLFSENGQQFVVINESESAARYENDTYYIMSDVLFGVGESSSEISFTPEFRYSSFIDLRPTALILEEITEYELLSHSSGLGTRESPETYRVRLDKTRVTASVPCTISNGMITVL